MFVGYPFGKKGWNLYDRETNEFFVSRDVIFDETSFPFASEEADHTEDSYVLFPPFDSIDDEEEHVMGPCAPTESVVAPTGEGTAPPTHTEEPAALSPPPTEAAASSPVQVEPAQQTDNAPLLGRGHRQPKPPTKLRDYVTYNAKCNPDNKQRLVSPDETSAASPTVPGKILYPIEAYVTDVIFSEKHQAFLAAVSAGVVPKSYKEDFLDKKWRNAVSHEVVALKESRTWDVVTLPKGKKAIGCQWLFKLKFNADGTEERPKARLVCLDNHQIEGEDYDETFPPVAKMSTVCILLEVAVAKG